jgi:hypothetical protein
LPYVLPAGYLANTQGGASLHILLIWVTVTAVVRIWIWGDARVSGHGERHRDVSARVIGSLTNAVSNGWTYQLQDPFALTVCCRMTCNFFLFLLPAAAAVNAHLNFTPVTAQKDTQTMCLCCNCCFCC